MNLALVVSILHAHSTVVQAQAWNQTPAAFQKLEQPPAQAVTLEHSTLDKNLGPEKSKDDKSSRAWDVEDTPRSSHVKRGKWSDWHCRFHYNKFGPTDHWPHGGLVESYEEARSTCTQNFGEARISCIKFLDHVRPGTVGEIREIEVRCEKVDWKCTVFVQLKDTFGHGEWTLHDPHHIHSGTSVYCEPARPRWIIVANPPSEKTCYQAPEIELGALAGGAESDDEESVVLLATDGRDARVSMNTHPPLIVPELHFEISDTGKPGTFKIYDSEHFKSSARLAFATTAASIFVRFCISMKPWQLRHYPRFQLTANAVLVHRLSRLESELTFKLAPDEANELKLVTSDVPATAESKLIDA